MYSNKGIILASQCDFSSNLSTLGALQIIQDAICIYFGEMGVDEIRLKRDFNSIWVFAKNKIKFLATLRGMINLRLIVSSLRFRQFE